MAIASTFSNNELTVINIPSSYSIGKILFITKEKPIQNVEGNFFAPYRDIENVKALFDNTGSLYAMVDTALKQNQGFITADSSACFGVYCMDGITDATQASKQCTISSIDDVKLITNGTLTATIDGEVYVLNDLNFSKCNDLADVSNIILNKGFNGDIDVDNDKITFKTKTFGKEGTIEITGSQDVIDAFDLTNATSQAGVDAVGFDLDKLVNDKIFEKFCFSGFTTDVKLDITTIKSIISKLVSLETAINTKMSFAYQMPSVYMSLMYNSELEKVSKNYQRYFSTITALLTNYQMYKLNGGLLSKCASTPSNVMRQPRSLKLNLTGKTIDDIDLSTTDKIMTFALHNQLLEHIAVFDVQYNQDGKNNVIQCSTKKWATCDAFFDTLIRETLKYTIDNIFKNQSNKEITLDENGAFSIKVLLYKAMGVFLSNKVLSTSINESDIDELQVNDKEECLEKIRTNGIYFETPDISTITNKILPVSYVSNLTSGIVKVDMQGYILKK